METGLGFFHGCIFFEKSLSFHSPVLCIIFKILKLPQNLSFKLEYFQKKLRKICKKWGKKTYLLLIFGLTFDIWPSWSWDIWDTLVVPGQFWLWYGWKLFSHEDFTQILTYRGTAMSGFLRGCLWLSPNWTNWPEILHVGIFWEATWPLQKQNLFWPPNVIGLYRGHMTLTWTKNKYTSQKILTCKIVH